MAEILFSVPAGQNLLSSNVHKQVTAEAVTAGLKIYVVGGYLRDLILNEFYPDNQLSSHDLDYAIAGGSAYAFAQKIADLLNGHFVGLDQGNDTARVVMPDGNNLDFAGCLGRTIEKDILRRDFTINSLYIDMSQPQVIVDRLHGIDDIKSGTIRATDPALFQSDPLRLLRAFRFATSLKFNIDRQTYTWITSNAQRLSEIAGERISFELFSIFTRYPTTAVLKMLAESGLIEVIFPELKLTRTVTNNAYHHLNLFDHSLEAVVQAEQELIAEPFWLKAKLTSELSANISFLAACKVASLLHDIGKPATWIITEAGKHTFIGHERLGAQMIGHIADRLRWSKPVERFIAKLIAYHLRPGQLFHHSQPSQRAINRLYRQMGDDFPALILLALGDLAATKGPQMTEQKSALLRQQYYLLLNGFEQYSLEKESRQKLLDGSDVMSLLDIPPGKEVGEILLALEEAQEINKVANRSQAEDFVRLVYQKLKKR